MLKIVHLINISSHSLEKKFREEQFLQSHPLFFFFFNFFFVKKYPDWPTLYFLNTYFTLVNLTPILAFQIVISEWG